MKYVIENSRPYNGHIDAPVTEAWLLEVGRYDPKGRWGRQVSRARITVFLTLS